MSTVSGEEKVLGFGPDYWMKNLVSPVQYYKAIKGTCDQYLKASLNPVFSPLFIEIGPHRNLASPMREIFNIDFPSLKPLYFPTLLKFVDSRRTILELLGNLFENGIDFDRGRIHESMASGKDVSCISDLPPYAWDHSQQYWHESRLSKEYRFRKHPYHDLLGVRLPTSTSVEPCWRNLVSVESQPWLKDHKVNDQIVFPGAAYITMAIEAKRQVIEDEQGSNPPENSSKYILRNVAFTKTLALPIAPGKTEMQLSMRAPIGLRKSSNDPLSEFRVTALDSDNMWSDCCSGSIEVAHEDGDWCYKSDDAKRALRTQTWDSVKTCQESAELSSNETLYSNLRDCGNDYGPSFSRISELLVHDSEHASALVETTDISETLPKQFMQPHIIHPTTLDALMHTSLPLYQRQHGKAFVMPLSIAEIRISSKLDSRAGSHLHVSSSMQSEDNKQVAMTVLATQSIHSSLNTPVVQMSNMRVRGFNYTNKLSRGREHPIWTTQWETVLDPYGGVGCATAENQTGQDIVILSEQNTGGILAATAFAANLQPHFPTANINVTSWSDLSFGQDSIYVILDNNEQPLLANLAEPTFQFLIKLVTKGEKIIWISFSFDTQPVHDAERSLINGFARSAHAENDRLQLVTLDCQDSWTSCRQLVIQFVTNICSHRFASCNTGGDVQDREFVIRDRQVLVPRVVRATASEEWISNSKRDRDRWEMLDDDISPGKAHPTGVDSYATYVVAGGLGFLGQKTCHLLVSHGAGHIVVLSRRHLSLEETRRNEMGLQTIAPNARLYYFSCDISIEREVQSIKLKMKDFGLPPVKGVIQSTVVLDVCTLLPIPTDI